MATRLNQLQTAFRRISILRSKWPDGDMSFAKLANSLYWFTQPINDNDDGLLSDKTEQLIEDLAYDVCNPRCLTPRAILKRLDDIHNRIHDEWAAERDAKAARKTTRKRAPKARRARPVRDRERENLDAMTAKNNEWLDAHSARMTFVDGRWVIAESKKAVKA